ncbi:MAG: hypothetical protein WBO70_01510 [Erysipelotrichaceae bacterium]
MKTRITVTKSDFTQENSIIFDGIGEYHYPILRYIEDDLLENIITIYDQGIKLERYGQEYSLCGMLLKNEMTKLTLINELGELCIDAYTSDYLYKNNIIKIIYTINNEKAHFTFEIKEK